MTRQEARERLWELVFGDPSREEAEVLEAAVREDPELAREVEALREIARVGRDLPAMPDDVRRRILQEARRHLRQRESGRTWQRVPIWPSMAMAAAVCLAVVGGWLWRHQQESLSHRGAEGLAGIEEPFNRQESETPGTPEPTPEAAPERPATREMAAGPQGGTLSGMAEGTETRGKIGEPGRGSAGRARSAAEPPIVRKEWPRTPAAKGETGVLAVEEGLGGGGAGARGQETAGRKADALPPAALPQAAPRITTLSSDLGESEAVGPATRPRDSRMAHTTREPAAAQVVSDRDMEDRCSDRVRELHRGGKASEALAEARACLTRPLTPSDLLDTLELAARIALETGRDEEARAYLDRLRALPGGSDRANRISPP